MNLGVAVGLDKARDYFHYPPRPQKVATSEALRERRCREARIWRGTEVRTCDEKAQSPKGGILSENICS